MSKELTEQWQNGTLPESWYYVHLKSNWGNIDCITINYCDEDGVFEEYPDEDIKEVLAPVPDYMDCKGLMYDSIALDKARKRVDELVSKTEQLEDRLKEAEKVIKFYADAQPLTDEEKQMTAEKYHLVYGLKAIDYLEKHKVEEV